MKIPQTKLRTLVALIVLILSGIPFVHAGHGNTGAYIYYRQIDSLVFDVYVELYRDCRTTSFADTLVSEFSMGCVSGGSVTNIVGIPIGIKSVESVLQYCSSLPEPCNPKNKAGAGPGIELFTYATRLDLSKSKYSKIRSCGKIAFQFQICCRTGDINTGSSSQNFYTYSEFDLQKTNYNSSPVVNIDRKILKLYLNQPNYINFYAIDTVDGDSVSFGMTYPQKGYHDPVGYNTKNSKDPVTTYDPTGLGLIRPEANPPQGFFIDSVYGMAIFTPTQNGQLSPFVFEYTEWRKDSSGKPVIISRGIREVQYQVVISVKNNLPEFDISPVVNVCAEGLVSFKIHNTDKIFVPPPPDPKPDPDTLAVWWTNYESPGWKLKIEDSSDIQPTLLFSWQLDSTMVRDAPYILNLHSNDNHCPFPGRIVRQVKFYVHKNPEFNREVKPIDCGRFRLNSYNQKGLSKFQWSVLDSNGRAVPRTVTEYSGGYSGLSVKSTDTVQIHAEGKFIIQSRAESLGPCVIYKYDTVYSHFSEGVKLFSRKDSSFCNNWKLDLYPDLIDTNSYFNFKWNTTGLDSSAGINIDNNGTQVQYILTANSPDGCPQMDSFSVYRYFSPELSPIGDILECEPLAERVDLGDYINTGGLPVTYLWSDASQAKVRVFSNSGKYTVVAANECGFDSTSFKVVEYLTPEINHLNDTTMCLPIDHDFKVINKNVQVGIPNSYKWNTGDTTTSITVTGPGFFYVVVSNQCGKDSTGFKVFTRRAPIADLGPDTSIALPFTYELSADSIDATYLWSTGQTFRTIEVSDTGTYWVTITNVCGSSSDTIHISAPVSVGEIDGKVILIYPNPNKGDFVIRHDGLHNVSIRISDLNGRQIQPQSMKSSNDQTSVKMGEQAVGIYMLEIRSENQVFTTRIHIE